MPPKRTRWASEQDFNTHKKIIMQMYGSGNMTVGQIMETMEKEYDFHATTKMYKSRFRKWNLWKHQTGNSRNDDNHTSQLVLTHHRTPDPDEFRSEELLYQAIRDYYDGAFSSRRWTSRIRVDDTSKRLVTVQHNDAGLAAAIQHTDRAMRRSEGIFQRFRAAIIMLERKPLPNNGSSSSSSPSSKDIQKAQRGLKESDFSQAVRLMRISFAELSQVLLDCDDTEAPLLPIWLIYIITLFRETRVRDFSSVETQLLRHLYELTSTSRHPTSRIWQGLVQNSLQRRHASSGTSNSNNNTGTQSMTTTNDRHIVTRCASIAVDQFSSHLGPLHPWTTDLEGLAIGLIRPNGTGSPDEKSFLFRRLLDRLEAATAGTANGGVMIYDSRHIDTVCCFASHFRHHGCINSGDEIPDQNHKRNMLEQGISLLESVLTHPVKKRAMESHPEGAFNMYSLLTRMNVELGRLGIAEMYIREAVELARREREMDSNNNLGQSQGQQVGGESSADKQERDTNGDLFEGLNGLEVVLRAQGKVEEADTVKEERRRLVKETLEMVGEREDEV